MRLSIMTPVGEKIGGMLGLRAYLEYVRDLQVVMVLLALACLLSAMGIFLLTRSHCRLKTHLGIDKKGPKPSQKPPVPPPLV
jgi:hypothetical protein